MNAESMDAQRCRWQPAALRLALAALRLRLAYKNLVCSCNFVLQSSCGKFRHNSTLYVTVVTTRQSSNCCSYCVSYHHYKSRKITSFHP